MILLPKGQGGYRGIGLVEVIWKKISSIINTHLRVAVSLHYTLHGFRQGRGMDTETFVANLAQQLVGIFHE